MGGLCDYTENKISNVEDIRRIELAMRWGMSIVEWNSSTMELQAFAKR